MRVVTLALANADCEFVDSRLPETEPTRAARKLSFDPQASLCCSAVSVSDVRQSVAALPSLAVVGGRVAPGGKPSGLIAEQYLFAEGPDDQALSLGSEAVDAGWPRCGVPM